MSTPLFIFTDVITVGENESEKICTITWIKSSRAECFKIIEKQSSETRPTECPNHYKDENQLK